jgi:hypothetical protein
MRVTAATRATMNSMSHDTLIATAIDREMLAGASIDYATLVKEPICR